MLKEGDKAPDFKLPSDSGKIVSLKELKGKKIILYFYPKDDTSGCTLQAKIFRDELAEFSKRGAVVLGVSKDSVDSHVKFKTKYGLNFSLLSDESGEVCEKYDVWKEKNMYGKTYMGIERTTFVIDENARIEKVFPKVKVEGHAAEVLKAAQAL